jgi:hypothetical protein
MACTCFNQVFFLPIRRVCFIKQVHAHSPAPLALFPRYGKLLRIFSTLWKIRFFHSMARFFPRYGKLFSTVWISRQPVPCAKASTVTSSQPGRARQCSRTRALAKASKSASCQSRPGQRSRAGGQAHGGRHLRPASGRRGRAAWRASRKVSIHGPSVCIGAARRRNFRSVPMLWAASGRPSSHGRHRGHSSAIAGAAPAGRGVPHGGRAHRD